MPCNKHCPTGFTGRLQTAIDILNNYDTNTPSHILCCAIEAVAVLRDESVVPRLVEILRQTEDERVFGVCSFALARIGGVSAIAALVDAYPRPWKDDVRSSLWYTRDAIASVIIGDTDGDVHLALKAAAICRPPGIETALSRLMSSENRNIRMQAGLAAIAYLPDEQLEAAASGMPEEDVSAKLRASITRPALRPNRGERGVIPPVPERRSTGNPGELP